jgi:hypothetical protein
MTKYQSSQHASNEEEKMGIKCIHFNKLFVKFKVDFGLKMNANSKLYCYATVSLKLCKISVTLGVFVMQL